MACPLGLWCWRWICLKNTTLELKKWLSWCPISRSNPLDITNYHVLKKLNRFIATVISSCCLATVWSLELSHDTIQIPCCHDVQRISNPRGTWTKSANRLGRFSIFGVFMTSYSFSCTVKSQKRGSIYRSPGENGLWRGNLTLFAVFNGYLVRFGIKSGKWKGILNSSGEAAVERGWNPHVVAEPIGRFWSSPLHLWNFNAKWWNNSESYGNWLFSLGGVRATLNYITASR